MSAELMERRVQDYEQKEKQMGAGTRRREGWERGKRRGEDKWPWGMSGRERRRESKSTLCLTGTFQKKLHVLGQKIWPTG